MQYLARILIITTLFFVSTAEAGNKSFGDYTIHYSVFNADFLSPQVAGAYGIKRSKKRAVINISVTEKNGVALPKPISAEISGKALNIYQQLKPMDLREIKEPGAFYYIAEFPISNEEIINFDITAKLKGKTIGNVKFKQTFFVD